MFDGSGLKFHKRSAVSRVPPCRESYGVKLRALLFDVDGTLAETETHGHRVSYNRAFRELGLRFRWSPQLYRKLLEAPGGRERLLHFRERYQPDLGIHAEQDPAAWAETVHRIKSQHFRRLLRRGQVPARPGVARLFAEAKLAGVRIAVVTNASRASVAAVLRYSLGPSLMRQVEFVVGAESVTHKKPHPEPYLRALEKLRLDAFECVAIEDSAQGLKSAAAAGIPTLVVQNDDTRGQDFSRAALVVDSLGEPGLSPQVLSGALDEDCVRLASLQSLVQRAAAGEAGRDSRAA